MNSMIACTTAKPSCAHTGHARLVDYAYLVSFIVWIHVLVCGPTMTNRTTQSEHALQACSKHEDCAATSNKQTAHRLVCLLTCQTSDCEIHRNLLECLITAATYLLELNVCNVRFCSASPAVSPPIHLYSAQNTYPYQLGLLTVQYIRQ